MNDSSGDLIRPAARVRRTFEEVALQLRAMFTGGLLRPGDRLPPERELSQQLGVSRSALREALRTLEISGVIELRKGRNGGAFITQGNFSAVTANFRDLLTLGNLKFEELAEARTWLAEIVVRVACERATEEDLDALEDNVREAERMLAEGRHAEKIDLNIEFHNLLARATRNPVLAMNVRTISDVMHEFADRYDERTDFGLAERRRLIAAMRARDTERATRELLDVMSRWHRYIFTMLLASRPRDAEWGEENHQSIPPAATVAIDAGMAFRGDDRGL
jgi:GntR family transcriptional repressor for pyruvate dehydrogenase complex